MSTSSQMGHAESAHTAMSHEGAVHEHPTWSTYKWVAIILTLITVVEVWCYYLPAFVASPFFVPTLLILSAVKFVIVVMFWQLTNRWLIFPPATRRVNSLNRSRRTTLYLPVISVFEP